MKNLAIISVLLLIVASCKKGDEVVPDTPISCSIVYPRKDTFELGDYFTISAKVNEEADLNNLELYINSILVAETTEKYLDFVFTSDTITEPGSVRLKAVAYNQNDSPSEDMKDIVFLRKSPIIKLSEKQEVFQQKARVAAVIEETHGHDRFLLKIRYGTTPPTDGVLTDYLGDAKYEYWDDNDTVIFELSGLRSDQKYYYQFTTQPYTNIYHTSVSSFSTLTFHEDSGSFVDSRDNKEYSYLTFNGVSWMSENLSYLEEIYPADSAGGTWVFNYNGFDPAEAKNTDDYNLNGVLYDYKTAMDICPSGWQLPTATEWDDLITYLNQTVDKNISGFQGNPVTRIMISEEFHEDATGEAGLNFMGTKIRDENGTFIDYTEEHFGAYWTANPHYIYQPYASMNIISHMFPKVDSTRGLRVRCIKEN